MNPMPNFDVKNPREYPGYGNVPISKDNLSTAQRIVKSFNGKVLFWATVALLAILALFENPLLTSATGNLTGNRLLFVAGLALGVCESIALQKRNEANAAPWWRRIALGIITLAALFLVFHFLGNNSFILSLCQGGVAGSGAWYAVATYCSNWASYS